MFYTCLSVILFTGGRGSLYDVTSCLAAWSHVPSGGLCLWFHVPSGGSLSRGGSPWQRLPWTETPLNRDHSPPYGKERAVRILLECILVSSRIYVCTQPTGKINAYNTYSLAITGTIFKFSKWHEESHREKLTSHPATNWNGISFVSSRSSLESPITVAKELHQTNGWPWNFAEVQGICGSL